MSRNFLLGCVEQNVVQNVPSLTRFSPMKELLTLAVLVRSLTGHLSHSCNWGHLLVSFCKPQQIFCRSRSSRSSRGCSRSSSSRSRSSRSSSKSSNSSSSRSKSISSSSRSKSRSSSSRSKSKSRSSSSSSSSRGDCGSPYRRRPSEEHRDLSCHRRLLSASFA